MKRKIWLLAFALLFSACSLLPANEAPASQPAAPEITQSAEPNEAEAIEGVVVPAQTSSMRFLVAGPVVALEIEEGAQVKAGDLLATLSTPALDSAVLAAEAELRAAEADLQYWLIPRRNKPPERRWLAEDRIDAAHAAIETALAEQAQQNIYAPYDATVIEVNTAVGEYLNAQQPLCLLADTAHLQVETTDLSERDVVQLALGQKVRLYVEALDLETEGKITAIAPRATEESNDVLFPVTIDFDEIPAGLRWGMTVQIDFAEE